MNKDWAELNKTMQLQIKKKDTFELGIDTLIKLRKELMEQILQFKNELSPNDFYAMPFMNAKGYHNKTIAYSLWHIFRIEDIVAHSLIADDEQIFFQGEYQSRINSPIITTANELVKEEIGEFSKELNIEEVYHYITDVDISTTQILKKLAFNDIKVKMTDEKKKHLEKLNVVSADENAHWLIDYWCGKDVKGLIQMPFSRHWIIHIEACLKIKDKLLSKKELSV
ncbi:MAG: phage head-tail adapter protein [Lachnospiraceae bacterium]|nr:phage head-tail adapter protein [Lachnospiraceae bacterium]